MVCPLSQSYLERLPKGNPYQICRFCVKETNDLLSIKQVSDFRILYLNLMNVEYKPGRDHPTLVCSSCMDMFRKITAFMGILYDVDIFWKAYENVTTVPVLIEATESNSKNAVPALPCDIEIKKDNDNQPTCNNAEENMMDVFESLLTAETSNIEVQAKVEPNIGNTKDLESDEIEKKVDLTPASLEIDMKKPGEEKCVKEATKFKKNMNCIKKLGSRVRKMHKVENIKPLMSVSCGFSPRTKDHLKRHIIFLPHVDRMARPYKCNICSESYQNSLDLSRHLMSTHSCGSPFDYR